MAQEQVCVPDLGGIDEVEVIEIESAVGDSLNAEDTLLVLESDKATMEVPVPNAGTVTEILVKVGDKVSSGTAVAMMDVAGEASSDSAQNTPEKTDEKEAEKPVEAKTEEAKADVVQGPSEKSASPTSGPKKVDVTVPDLGGIDEVEVIELCIAVGETLEAEESLIVLESDKATMEVPVAHGGTVMEYKVKAGDKVSQGDLLAVMEVQQTTQDNAANSSSAQSADKPASQSVESTDKPATAKHSSQPHQHTDKAPASQISDSASSGAHVHAGPAVRKLARELGVELSQVTGSGPKNRIVKEDVQQFVKQRLSQPSSSPNTAAVVGSQEDFSRFGAIEEVALNKIKQVTARNMVQSWSTIPQVTQFDEADITELETYRKGQMQGQLPDGVKVSPLAFILKACTKALMAFPEFNASLGPNADSLILKSYYNIGIAVDTPDGLLVPVIKGTEQKGVIELAQASSELAKQARDKKLPMDAMSGGCFTISSLGGIGGTAFTPIVSAPQVAILGVSKAAYKPVWNGSSFEPRLMLPLSLSYDHRVIDGAQAAQFSKYLCQLLTDVRHLLL